MFYVAIKHSTNIISKVWKSAASEFSYPDKGLGTNFENGNYVSKLNKPPLIHRGGVIKLDSILLL